ncbi:uncharacterized protein Z520_00284 [Fonsecaea multimorphosa CBS 102226]|uniref:Uncharacterized protein n=1 Tax=Fonsecaea multimorphosa CBS 102226 TaxID=1442371 RepID=A0A0D2KBW4_9EURO|nr:uncharacterized protein Z520_00284 [Fonsecaea multimorphosa CBS 102226]KIY03593.1 hypothetical protein Z520_00284 [Fonsecaea multimorphosa CBS 102226]
MRKHVLQGVLRKISLPLRYFLRNKPGSTQKEPSAGSTEDVEIPTANPALQPTPDLQPTPALQPASDLAPYLERVFATQRRTMGRVKSYKVTIRQADPVPEQHAELIGSPKANESDVQINDGAAMRTESIMAEVTYEQTPSKSAEDGHLSQTAVESGTVARAQVPSWRQVATDDKLNGPGPEIRDVDLPSRANHLEENNQQHAAVGKRQKYVRFDTTRNQTIVLETQQTPVRGSDRQSQIQVPALQQHRPVVFEIQQTTSKGSDQESGVQVPAPQQHRPVRRNRAGTNQSSDILAMVERMSYGPTYHYNPWYDYNPRYDMMDGGQTRQNSTHRRLSDLWTSVHIEFDRVKTPGAPMKPTNGLCAATEPPSTTITDQAQGCKWLVQKASMHLGRIRQIKRLPKTHRANGVGLDNATCRLPCVVMAYLFSGFTEKGGLELMLGICSVISRSQRDCKQDPQHPYNKVEQPKHLIPIEPNGPNLGATPSKVCLERGRFSKPSWIDTSKIYYVPAGLLYEGRYSNARLSKGPWLKMREALFLGSLAEERARFERAFDLYQARHNRQRQNVVAATPVCQDWRAILWAPKKKRQVPGTHQ